MPNRIISSGILTSDSLAQLSWFEQCVFFRLIVLCDDFGRYDGRPAVIRGQAFSLHNVTTTDIQNALSRLVAVGIVSNYIVDGRPYIQLEHWGKYQRLRNSKAKFPAPQESDNPPQEHDNSPQLAATRGESPQLAATCGLNPNPNPNPNPNYTPPTPHGGEAAAAGLGRCADFYQQNIGTLSPSTYQQMQEWLSVLPDDVLILAMQAAADNGKRNWAYIKGVLKRCADTGIRSKADWDAAEEARNSGLSRSEGKRSPASEAREKLRQIAGGAFDEN